MFPASHDFIIQDSKFVNVQGNYHALPETAGLTSLFNFFFECAVFPKRSPGLHNLLRKHIAHGASHDSEERSPPPKCHPETRRRVVKDIMDWIGDPVRHSRVLWLNGPAGAGKSAIAQSVSDMYKENKQLAASFFFSRTVPGRNNTKNLFPTITYQLASAIPSLSKIIEGIIEGDPSIFEKSIQIQLERLIVEPLQQLEPDILATMVIIIDGLDECGGEKTQVSLLDLVKFAAERIPVCFLISSRPEAWLQDAFGSSSLQKLTFRLTLDERYNPDTDIRTFLRAEFSRIHDEPRHRHSMSSVSKPWPPDDDIERLVAKASGQFIYASTVLRFVDDPHQHPVDQLKTILGIRATQSSPFAELDQLYRQILSSSPDEERMMKVLRLLFVLVAYGSDIFIDIFFHVPGGVFTLTEKMLMFRPSDIHSSLRGLHSLLLISDPSESDFYNGSLVKFHHASFPDFLTEEHRSKGYFINVASVCGDIAMSCLSIMSNPPINGDQSDFGMFVTTLALVSYLL